MQLFDTLPGWLIVAYLFLAALLYSLLPGERRRIGVVNTLFVLAMLGRLTYYFMSGARAVLIISNIVEGMCILNLSGIALTGALLPKLGIRMPRIMQETGLTLATLGWIFYCMSVQGVDVTEVIATSAVVTAVIGLSLQDTLGNIVGGLAVQIDNSVRVGDWIKMDDVSGRVVETRWRCIAVETRNWETVWIPNSMLARSKVYVLGHRQDAPLQVRRWVWFNVDFRCSPTRVIETVEAAIRSAEVPRMASEPAPNCVLMDFSDSYCRYAVRYWLTDLAADDPTDSEVRSHIFSALQRAGITLSIPAHAIFMTEQTEQRKAAKQHEEQVLRLRALQQVELFKSLPEDALTRLADDVVVAPYVRGDIITRQGAEAHWLYVIINGTAEREVETEDHRSLHLGDLIPGSVFGEYSLMTGQRRECSVLATSQVTCYRIGKDVFQDILRERPQLAEEFSVRLAAVQANLQAALHQMDEEARQRHQETARWDILKKIREVFGLGD